MRLLRENIRGEIKTNMNVEPIGLKNMILARNFDVLHWENEACRILGNVTPKELERITEESSGKSSGKTEERIVRLLSVNGRLTIPEMADTLGITTRAIEKQIASLRGQGRLHRVGPTKGVQWEVVK